MLLIPFLEATAEYQRLKAFRQGEITMISLEKSMAKDMARFFRHQGSVLLEYLPEEFDDSDFQRAWDRTQLETYLEFRDLLLKHKRRAAYTCLRALENELSVPLEEAAKPRTIGTKISFDDFDEEAYKHIEQYAGSRISQIDDTTKKDIREIIAKGFKGELQPDGTTKYKTHQQIAKDIKDKFKEFGDPVKGPSHIRNRAHLVAVTELREAGETSKQLARNRMEERGWQMLKRWMNMGDDRVSDGCIENGNAGWIDNREAFPSGHQFPPRFPGCRCGAGSKVGDRKEKSGLPDDRWIVTRQGDKVIVKQNPKYANGYDKPIVPGDNGISDFAKFCAVAVVLSAKTKDKYPVDPDTGMPLIRHTGDRNASQIGKWDLHVDSDIPEDVKTTFNEVLTDIDKEFKKLHIPNLRGQIYISSLGVFGDMGDGIIGLNKPDLIIHSFSWDENIPQTSNWIRKDPISERPRTTSEFFGNGKDRVIAGLYHELGHQIHQQYKVNTPEKYLNPPLERILETKIVHNWKDNSPTLYGSKSKREWFAENYALMKMNKKSLCDPIAIKLFKELGLI